MWSRGGRVAEGVCGELGECDLFLGGGFGMGGEGEGGGEKGGRG